LIPAALTVQYNENRGVICKLFSQEGQTFWSWQLHK